jgi:sialic acid synthase SpsE
MYGSDQAASLEFSGMKNLTSSLEKMTVAFGENKIGHVTEEEKLIAKKLRGHINLNYES